MEEILDTWPHKSLNEKWKWKVWVLPWFFSFLSFTHIISGKRGREKISSAKVRTSLVPAKKTWVTEAAELTSAGCARGAEQKALDSIYVCSAPCLLWAYCHVLHDPLWSLKIYDLSHRKYKGLLLSLGLDTQKFTWIMKNPCVKLMWVCHSNFILVRWFIYLSKMVYRNHNQHGLLQ